MLVVGIVAGGSVSALESLSANSQSRSSSRSCVCCDSQSLSRSTENVNHDSLTERTTQLFDYVILGYGLAGREALRVIRHREPDSSVCVVLEHGMASGESQAAELRPTSAPPTTFISKRMATRLDIANRILELEGGKSIRYGRSCLLALQPKPRLLGPDTLAPGLGGRVLNIPSESTVGRPFHLDSASVSGSDSPSTKVPASTTGPFRPFRIAIVGSGLPAVELAASLAGAGKDRVLVSHVYRDPSPLSSKLPQYLSSRLAAELRELGIDQHPYSVASYLRPGPRGDRVEVNLRKSYDKLETWQLRADLVLVAPSENEPETSVLSLSPSGELELDQMNGGVMVNTNLMAVDGVYAAGDIISFPDPRLGRRRAHSADHCVASGRTAALNMTGVSRQYSHQPVSSLDLRPLGASCHLIGLTDSCLESVGFWRLGTKQVAAVADAAFATSTVADYLGSPGVIYYLRDMRVVGVALWNLPTTSVDLARNLILSPHRFQSPEELRRLALAVPVPDTNAPCGAALAVPVPDTNTPVGAALAVPVPDTNAPCCAALAVPVPDTNTPDRTDEFKHVSQPSGRTFDRSQATNHSPIGSSKHVFHSSSGTERHVSTSDGRDGRADRTSGPQHVTPRRFDLGGLKMKIAHPPPGCLRRSAEMLAPSLDSAKTFYLPRVDSFH